MGSLMIKPNFKLSDQLSLSQPWSSRVRTALMLLAGPGCGVRTGMGTELSQGDCQASQGPSIPQCFLFLGS